MSVETKPNKLVKGLVLDTFHTDVDNTVATYALNAQLEDQEGNHFHYGSEVGTTYIKNIPDTHVVIGHINMERNETVLFTTDGTNSTIGILSRNDDMSYQYEIKVDDSRQEKKLNFKKNTYIRGVYRLLNGCDKVIYFVDGINKDRRININQLDSYKTSDIEYIPPVVIPEEVIPEIPIVVDNTLQVIVYALSSATGNIQLIRLLQSNVSAIGSVNAILESTQQGLVEIDVTLSGVASSTVTLLRATLLETNVTAQATTIVDTIVTKIINAQVQALANTTASAQISISVNATVDAVTETSATVQLSKVISTSVDALANSSSEALIGLVLVSTNTGSASISTADLYINRLLTSSVTAQGTTTAELIIAELLSSAMTASANTTANLQLADVLTTSVSAAATVSATLTSEVPMVSVDYLVIAGGGGGGSTLAGGGGAGGYREGTLSVVRGQTRSIIVGSGGDGASNRNIKGSNGTDSIFSTITSTGGGGGGSYGTSPGAAGGSGGGAAGAGGNGGAGNTPITSPSQGNTGGNSVGGYSAGGGGAGAVGANGFTPAGGNGGVGRLSSISGTPIFRAGGGGGGVINAIEGVGGNGGGGAGGDGGPGVDGTVNTGGGGGGGSFTPIDFPGGKGGSGVVIIKIPESVTATFTNGVTFSLSTNVSGFKIYTVTATSDLLQTVTFTDGLFDADASAFFARVTTAGGSLTSTEQNAVNTLVSNLKGNGTWTKMKAIYPMVGGGQTNPAAACAQNLKSASFTGTFTGCTFASTGVTPNGTSGFMDTNCNPNSFTSWHKSIYSRTTNTTGRDIGIESFDLILSLGGTIYSRFGSSNVITTNADSKGFYISTEAPTLSHKLFKNGSQLGTTQAFNGSYPNYKIFIGAISVANVANYFTTREFAFASIGDGLTDTEASNFYTAVQTFQTTLNRQV